MTLGHTVDVTTSAPPLRIVARRCLDHAHLIIIHDLSLIWNCEFPVHPPPLSPIYGHVSFRLSIFALPYMVILVSICKYCSPIYGNGNISFRLSILTHPYMAILVFVCQYLHTCIPIYSNIRFLWSLRIHTCLPIYGNISFRL